jgi:hypothetical protein
VWNVGKPSVGAGPPEDLVTRIYETTALVSPGRLGVTRLDWYALGLGTSLYAWAFMLLHLGLRKSRWFVYSLGAG